MNYSVCLSDICICDIVVEINMFILISALDSLSFAWYTIIIKIKMDTHLTYSYYVDNNAKRAVDNKPEMNIHTCSAVETLRMASLRRIFFVQHKFEWQI